MYAVEMFFNEEIENYVRLIWSELSDEKIDSSLISIKYLKPHITLATYKNLNLENYKNQFKTFSQKFEPIDINFVTLGVFPTTGTVYTAPIVTEEILNLHKNYHSSLIDFKSEANFYYLPGFWNPHCTFGIKLQNDNLTKVFNYCLSKFKCLSGKITEIGLVETVYENSICVSSPRIV